jgi:ribosomal protein S18 acetylase RimI-like enzyme
MPPPEPSAPTGAVRIRPFDRPRDEAGACALDVSFTSGHVYRVRMEEDGMRLEPVPSPEPVSKAFPLDLDADPWQQAFVAVEGDAVLGFVACSYQSWNRRLTVWHFYVDRAHRGRGIGRGLMDHALEAGRRMGAVTAWAETSNRNHPGVALYRRLGFELCGFDLSLYRGTPVEGEFALFLARDLRAP